MKRNLVAAVGVLMATGLGTPAIAENFAHTRTLLQTRSCIQCDLSDAGLVMASLARVNLEGAVLTRANLSRATLEGANLSGADLSGASLFGANLRGANLRGANLQGADLRQAYLVDVDLTGARLDGAFLEGAIGTPRSALSAQDIYNWGVMAAQRQNHAKAIEYFNQAINIDPEFGLAYLARAVVRADMGNSRQAIADARAASEVFAAKNEPQNFETSQMLIAQIEAFEEAKARGNNNSGGSLRVLGSLGISLLRLLL
ncbi:pentapeptide repeat-containing protein [[Phormidium] sp. ETS-05]|uniref:pentapeptide repeat-containing protein n=1 Tax=[Phormidium] sp. ETS-05 TaxID=222819 RepID=UPI0018EF18C1|nr:pentapeptide repeat-containing protein [[Phormidium] sp. ETS-05]